MDNLTTTTTSAFSPGALNGSFGGIRDKKVQEMMNLVKRQTLLNNVCLSMVFSLIVLVSLFGNSLVVYVIYCNKRMHTVTNVFITNLAIADLLITLLNIPFNIIRFILDDWLFGDVMCRLINYVQTISVYAFTFTLVMIALDRYRVIMFPLRPRISMKVAFLLIFLIWLLSALLSIPFGLYYGQKKIKIFNSTRCTKLFPPEMERYIYLGTVIAQYIIPLVVISVSYGHIARHLWARVTLGHVTRDQQLIHMKSKKKTIKMLATVVLAFAVLWMPMNVYFLLLYFPPPESGIKPSAKTVFSCYWVAVSSVMINPFIYSWFNEAFRTEVFNRFRCCLRKKRRIHPGYEIDGLLVRSDVATRTRTERWRSESVPRCNRRHHEIPVLEITPPPEDMEGTPMSDFGVNDDDEYHEPNGEILL